jgi:hypothetical protein
VAAHDDPLGAALLAEYAVARLTTTGQVAEARDALGSAVAAVGAHRGTDGPDGADAVERRHRAVIDWLSGGSSGPAPGPVGDPVAVAGPSVPAGDLRLHALGLAALAACDSGDVAAANEIHARLAPYADRVCGVGYRTFVGAAAFHLGRLAALTGDWAEAERHLLSALRLHSAWRARPWVALTQAALAGVLEARDRPSDREWIAGLRAEADYVTATLGLRTI